MDFEKKRVFWLDEEVETMLDIIRKEDIIRQLDGKTKRNNIVYKRISKSLMQKQFYKSSDQIKSKLRFMKKNYFDVKRNHTNDADRKTCPYFEQLDEMYGRQVASDNGDDTWRDEVLEMTKFSDVDDEPVDDFFDEKKSTFWRDEEVEMMLKILRENDVVRQLDGKTRRNNIVYKRISNDLRRKNFYKSSDQIKSKLRIMKKSYFDARRHNESETDRKTCPYFQQLDEMYGQQVVSNKEDDTWRRYDEPEVDKLPEVDDAEKKKVYWLDQEVETMLEIIKGNDILRQLDGKTKRNNVVYKKISEYLRHKNIYKSSDQIKTKLRFMRKNYFDVKRNNDASDTDRKICPFFMQLDEMYGRPIAPREWIGTSMDDETELIMFPDADNAQMYEFDSEIENTSFTVKSEDSLVKRKEPETISLSQAIAQMTEEFRNGIDRLTEQNKVFLNEQRRMNADFMTNMQKMLADDREATHNFLESLLSKK